LRASLKLLTAFVFAASTAVVAQTPTAPSAKSNSTKASSAQPKPGAATAARVQGTVPAGKAPIAATTKAAPRPKTKPAKRVQRPSEGQVAGLHRTDDPLDLKSSVALVINQDTNEVLFEKNTRAVLPIASITKLMTALVTVESGLPLDEELKVAASEQVRAGVRSNLRPGTALSRGTALHLALMSSENRAAQLLGRTYPGGLDDFVAAMNAKARMLGMEDSHFADPTGLSADNRSSAADLVRLVKAVYEHDVIREYSTTTELAVPVGKRLFRYGNTNRLTANPDWHIGVQKTGYISAAGRCLVMQAVVEGERIVMVLLDSVGKYSRLGDAQRIRDWLEAGNPVRGSAKPTASVGDNLKPI